MPKTGNLSCIIVILGFLPFISHASDQTVYRSPNPNTYYAIPIHKSTPQLGKKNALVTIIEFNNFYCASCKKISNKLFSLANSDDDVRLVFKHNPPIFNTAALSAAKTTIAAHKQDKFWSLHHYLYNNQQFLGEESPQRWAAENCLGLRRFKKDYSREKTSRLLEDDFKLAKALGIFDTPTVFINGKIVTDFNHIKRIIAKEKALALHYIASNNIHPSEFSYERMIKSFSPPENARQKYVFNTVEQLNALPSSHAVKGPDNAPLQIIECADLHCPFCQRANKNFNKALEKYAGKVQLHFIHYPVSGFTQSLQAALTAIAADEQGKFWEFYEAIYLMSKDLSIDLASQVGLDTKKWFQAIHSDHTKNTLRDHVNFCRQSGAIGTPTFIINDRVYHGTIEQAVFDNILEEELERTASYEPMREELS